MIIIIIIYRLFGTNEPMNIDKQSYTRNTRISGPCGGLREGGRGGGEWQEVGGKGYNTE